MISEFEQFSFLQTTLQTKHAKFDPEGTEMDVFWQKITKLPNGRGLCSQALLVIQLHYTSLLGTLPK